MRFNWRNCEVRVYTGKETVYPYDNLPARYLPDFIRRCRGEPSFMDTGSILESQRETLRLQAEADAGKTEPR